MRVLVPGFSPQSSGLRFANAFPHVPDIEVDLPPPFGRIRLGDAANGLCGGMSFTVADLYNEQAPPPEDPDPPDAGTERFDYLVARQVDSLDRGRLPARFYSLMSPVRPRRQGDVGLGDSRTHVMVQEEWPAIKAEIDQGKVAMVGLVKVVSEDPRSLNRNHQVLAFGYELDGADARLLILDPNFPRREIQLGVDVSDAMGETTVTYGTSDGDVVDASVACFFHYPYTPRVPVPWVATRADDGPAERVQVQMAEPAAVILDQPRIDWAGAGIGPILGPRDEEERVEIRGPIIPAQPAGPADAGAPMASTPARRPTVDYAPAAGSPPQGYRAQPAGPPPPPPPPSPTLGRVRGIRFPDPLGWTRGILSRGSRAKPPVDPGYAVGRDITGTTGNVILRGLGGRPVAANAPAPADEIAAGLAKPEKPPHVAYGLVDCLAEAVAEVAFDVTVGLAPKPSPGVAGVAINLPPLETQPYSVFVRLVAPGFTFAPGEAHRRELRVSKATPYPTETIRLIPRRPKDGHREDRRITAEFSMEGVRIADAIRVISVVATAAARARPSTDHVQAGVDIAAPTSSEAADLTITIRYADKDDWLAWTLDTPHTDVVHPADKPALGLIGKTPEAFLVSVTDIGADEGTGGVYAKVLGLGRDVAGAVPPVVWQAIRAVALKTGRPPSILLVSEEPYIPWELALVDPALLPTLKTSPPFLGAQARIGRWLQAVTESDGQGRPKPTPPAAKQVHRRAVIWGDYSKTEWASLNDARDEAQELIKDYGMVTIEPTNKAMFDLLKDRMGPDLLHFAVHGHWSADATDVDGIVLTDGGTLEAPQISGRTLDQAPVVFLNACQVGAGHAVLGRYSGIAAAFVEAGASGVIAPLWSINDAIARGVALDFYKRVAAGESPSEVLRSSRSVFVDDYDTKSATTMAYQFFGHPGLTVTGLS